MNISEQHLPISPVYAELKDLHLETELVREGQPNVTIITPASGIYEAQAVCIQRVIEERTGFSTASS